MGRLSAWKGPKVSTGVYVGNVSQSLRQLSTPETPVGGTAWEVLDAAAWMEDEKV